MRHLHTHSHFRHALFVLQDAEGYVDALLEMARDEVVGRHSSRRRDRFEARANSVQFSGRRIPTRH